MNGRKWSGKGYNYQGNEVCEIKDGNGIFKEFNYNGELIFEGEYLLGERNGTGKEFYENKLSFEGEFKDGERWNGKGFEHSYDYGKFEGEYLNGNKWNGKIIDNKYQFEKKIGKRIY